MPLDASSILILAGIVFAFTLFAAALAWADFQCRRPKH
jgi:hypothetical protein